MRFMTSITAASICLSMTNINTASAESACEEAAIRSHLELMAYCKFESETPTPNTSADTGAVARAIDPAISMDSLRTNDRFANYIICENTAMRWYLAERSAC